MAAGKYPSCLLGSRACRTGWLRTVIFLLSVALALNLGLLLGVRLSAAILDSVPAAVALAVVWLVLLLIAAVIQRRETRYRNGRPAFCFPARQAGGRGGSPDTCSAAAVVRSLLPPSPALTTKPRRVDLTRRGSLYFSSAMVTPVSPSP